MLLGGNQNIPSKYSTKFPKTYLEEIDFYCSLIRSGCYEEVWSLISAQKLDSIPLCYCRAICQFQGRFYEDCLNSLQHCLSALKALRPTSSVTSNLEINRFHDIQKEQATYLNPVGFQYVDNFSQLLIESVLRLMVDCWSALNNNAKVIELGTPLKNRGYLNVIVALEKAAGN